MVLMVASLRDYFLFTEWDILMLMIFWSSEGIKLGYNDGKVLENILWNLDEITLGIDVGKDLGSLDISFDGSNDGKL